MSKKKSNPFTAEELHKIDDVITDFSKKITERKDTLPNAFIYIRGNATHEELCTSFGGHAEHLVDIIHGAMECNEDFANMLTSAVMLRLQKSQIDRAIENSVGLNFFGGEPAIS
jgi:hypothetical protein